MENVNLLSPSVLAFVGDAVYGLYVRTKLAEVNRPSGELHKLSVKLVSAPAQAKAYAIIEDKLSEKEISIFKRGRNFHTSSAPKSATKGEYHTATGLESLFGYLYLEGNTARADELFNIIWIGMNQNQTEN
ncbi:MAG: ribonuclease III [Clostridia bacterium]|nr:ribonuclease III [Clostridia bacterium]